MFRSFCIRLAAHLELDLLHSISVKYFCCIDTIISVQNKPDDKLNQPIPS